VAKGKEPEELDFYITNVSDDDFTKFTLGFFEGETIEVAKVIRPGENAMCGIGGEIGDTMTFQSDQFPVFRFEIPDTPLDSIDTSTWKLAGLPAEAETTTDDVNAPGVGPDKNQKKKSPPRDLLYFGDDEPTTKKGTDSGKSGPKNSKKK